MHASLGDVLKKVIKNLGSKGRFTEEEMLRAWAAAVGPEAAKHSRPVSFRRASIFVNVDRSTWLHELTVRKKDILAGLGERLGVRKFKDIRFRIGEITKKEQGT